MRGPSVVQLSDEATQELPGEIYYDDGKRVLPQLLTFSDLSATELQLSSQL